MVRSAEGLDAEIVQLAGSTDWVLEARIESLRLPKGGVTRWGESSEPNYGAYVDFLLEWGIIEERVRAQDLITSELIGEVNQFNVNEVMAPARAYRAK
jgi:NitT/TauT family transport system substrate-binding protein